MWYRVGKPETQQGLWYTPSGEFSGLIHTEYNFCKASALQMPYDEELVGYISVTQTLAELFKWFSKEELLRLQDEGYCIFVYECANEYTKYYEPYQHWVISQERSSIIGRIILEPVKAPVFYEGI